MVELLYVALLGGVFVAVFLMPIIAALIIGERIYRKVNPSDGQNLTSKRIKED
jgi:hypothetical protein